MAYPYHLLPMADPCTASCDIAARVRVRVRVKVTDRPEARRDPGNFSKVFPTVCIL